MIAVDWGTTNVRAWRLAADGTILERRERAQGIMVVEQGAFASVLDDFIGSWIDEGAGPVFMCGMVGSRQGWIEVPYVPCPASLDDVVAGVREVRWRGNRRSYICPGLSCEDAQGVPDVIRGEETKALGAMEHLPAGPVDLRLPGTHSKHLRVRDGVIESFTTHMTGEMFALLRNDSILARMMEGDAIDPEGFEKGVHRSRDPGGLLHHLFGVRACALLGKIAPHALSGYLSGILIGHEINACVPAQHSFVIAASDVGSLYARALALSGSAATLVESDAAARGLFRIAQSLEGGRIPC
jgi:2-dehydro-3-deoxygalactonokinase